MVDWDIIAAALIAGYSIYATGRLVARTYLVGHIIGKYIEAISRMDPNDTLRQKWIRDLGDLDIKTKLYQ